VIFSVKPSQTLLEKLKEINLRYKKIKKDHANDWDFCKVLKKLKKKEIKDCKEKDLEK
jgi:hypothetical protein